MQHLPKRIETLAEALRACLDCAPHGKATTREQFAALAAGTALLAALDAEKAAAAKGNSHPLPILSTGDALRRVALHMAEEHHAGEMRDCKTRDDFCVFISNMKDEAADLIGLALPEFGDEEGDVIESIYNDLRAYILDNSDEFSAKLVKVLRRE